MNAVYANKIAEMDEAARAEFVAQRQAEYCEEVSLMRMASDLIVDAVVAPEDLRAEMIRRLRASEGWERREGTRHHLVWPG